MSLTVLLIWAGATAVLDAIAQALPAGITKNILTGLARLGPGQLVGSVQAFRGK